MTKERYAASLKRYDPKGLTTSVPDLLFTFFTMNDVEGKRRLCLLSAQLLLSY
jgi:hypothetical protein